MAEDNRRHAYEYLLELATRKGYVVFDDIIDAADEWQLPLADVDWLSGSITTRGILVYDDPPGNMERAETDDNDDYYDYAQIDYEAVYSRIIEREPGLAPLIEEVRKIIPPQKRELSSIIHQAQEGNQYARNRIVEMHLRQALRIALSRAEQYDADLVDCVGDAFVGLQIATDRYEPSMGPFGSYASLWILQNISRNQKTQCPDVYYPVHKKEDYYNVYPMLKDEGCLACRKIWDCKEVLSLVNDKLGYSQDDKNGQDAIFASLPFDSFEEIVSSVEDEDLYRIIGVTGFPARENWKKERMLEELCNEKSLEEAIEQKQCKERIDEVLETLTTREQKVLRERYGLDDGFEKTLEEVGKMYGVTRERIRQIEAKALRKLRHPSRSRKVKEFLD